MEASFAASEPRPARPSSPSIIPASHRREMSMSPKPGRVVEVFCKRGAVRPLPASQPLASPHPYNPPRYRSPGREGSASWKFRRRFRATEFAGGRPRDPFGCHHKQGAALRHRADTSSISPGRVPFVGRPHCLLALIFAPSASAAQVLKFKEVFGSVVQPTFSKPAGMAVDQATGDLLVVD